MTTTATALRAIPAANLHRGMTVTDLDGNPRYTVFDYTITDDLVTVFTTVADQEDRDMPRSLSVCADDTVWVVEDRETPTEHEDHTQRAARRDGGDDRVALVQAARDLVVAYAMSAATHGDHSAHLARAWNRYSRHHLHVTGGVSGGTGRSIADAAAHAARLLASYTA